MLATPEKQKQQAEKATRLIPFTRAAIEHEEPGGIDETIALTAATQQRGPFDVPAAGFLRHIVLLVVGTTAGNAAAVTFAADGPFNVLADVQLTDVNGAPIVGPVSGYDLFLINKYGGYENMSDPRQSPVFSTTTGGGATGGSFAFLLRVPLEFRPRDAIGALANMNAAASYKLRYALAASATIYGVAPTTPPSVRVRSWIECWTQPDTNDLAGHPQAQQPPGLGTTSYWSKNSPAVNLGANTVRLPRVGNLIRNLICVQRTAAGVRITTDFPDPIQLVWDGRFVTNRGRDYFRHLMAERFDLAGAVDAADGLDLGVFVFDFTHDFDGKPGGELSDGYLQTVQSTRLELVGSWGAAGSVDIITNDVAPVGDVI